MRAARLVAWLQGTLDSSRDGVTRPAEALLVGQWAPGWSSQSGGPGLPSPTPVQPLSLMKVTQPARGQFPVSGTAPSLVWQTDCTRLSLGWDRRQPGVPGMARVAS